MNRLDLGAVEVYETKPDDFNASLQVSACYLEIEGKLLLLECRASKREAGKWGVPAGKIEKNEHPLDAAKRELFEETGIETPSSHLLSLGVLYIRKPNLDYVYHLFKVPLDTKPCVRLSDEHPAYLWASEEDIKKLPLMAGALEALNKYKKESSETILEREFYFIRHGQTDFNLSLVKVNHEEISLNATGKKQALDRAPLMNQLPFQTICCSPLKRAKETKELLLPRTKHVEIEELGECTAEIWKEMTSLKENAFHLGSLKVKVFLEKVKKGLNQALKYPGPVLIVAHGGVHFAICHWMEIEEHNWIIGNCKPVHFVKSERWRAKLL